MSHPAIARLQLLQQKHWLWRAALILSVIVISWLATSNQGQALPSTGWDKANHTLAFLQITLLMRLGWPLLPVKTLITLILSYGVFIELVQAWLPHRHLSGLDLVADMVGIALGLLVWLGYRRWQTQP